MSMKAALPAIGAVTVTTLGTACCWGPPLAVALLGTSGSFFHALHPYMPYLWVIMGVKLAVAFWLVYRPCNHSTCNSLGSADGSCTGDHASNLRTKKIILWIVATAIVGLNVWQAQSHVCPPTTNPNNTPWTLRS